MLLRLCLCALIAVFALQAQVLPAKGRGGGVVGNIGTAAPQNGPPAPPPPSDCAVSGTVVNAITGEPIPRAMVSLGGFDGAGSATDAKGEWNITNTSCTRNRPVNAVRIGFINSQMTQNNSSGRPVTVNLVSGSPVTGVKVSLMPEASIAGKVLDENSDPVENARVQAMRVVVQAGQRMVQNAGGGATDSQGNFRMGGLQPGRYVICAGSPQLTYPVGGGPAMVYREDCYPGPAASALSIAMPVDAGREVRASFTLTPVLGVHVRGKVVGSHGRGPIQLTKNERNSVIGPNLNAEIQNDGSFDIRSVLPGSYIATANWASNPPGQPNIAQALVEVGNSDVDNVSLSVQPGGSLSGTVRYEFSNPMTPANPQVNINLRPGSNSGSFFGRIPQVQWDPAHASFDFADIQPNNELLMNANVNGQGVYVKSATLRGQDVLNHPFSVQGTAGPVDVVVSDETGSIDITVNDSDGHAAIDAGVLMLSAYGLRRILRSGDDGHATQQNIPTGDYRVWAWDNIQAVPYAEEDWMNQNAGPGEKISIASGSSANLTVKRQAAPAQ